MTNTPINIEDNSKLGASTNTLGDTIQNNSNALEKQSRKLDAFQ